ncbi:MAG: glycosyl transferase [Deltaproteobacteria bacterium]|nr:MAG: glycosyl transferase [Deltaproteobacteria bacterium]
MQPEISIVIPAFNESENIGGVIQSVKRYHPDAEIIVVDDGSSDNTAEVAHEAGATVYSHPYNIGNGAAVKTGIRVARGKIFVFMDADGQHRPEDISRLLEFFPEYDMIVGERHRGGQASAGRAFGNKVFNWLASYVTKFPVRDLTSGFRAVKAEIAKSYLFLLPNTYSYPTTITLGVLRDGRSLKYMPIDVRQRKTGKSRIRMVNDGIRFLMIIIRICTLYSPLRIFLPVSCCMFSLGLIRYIYSYIYQGRFTNMSALLFISSVIIFMMGLVSEQICQMRFERRVSDRRVKKYTVAKGSDIGA